MYYSYCPCLFLLRGGRLYENVPNTGAVIVYHHLYGNVMRSSPKPRGQFAKARSGQTSLRIARVNVAVRGSPVTVCIDGPDETAIIKDLEHVATAVTVKDVQAYRLGGVKVKVLEGPGVGIVKVKGGQCPGWIDGNVFGLYRSLEWFGGTSSGSF